MPSPLTLSAEPGDSTARIQAALDSAQTAPLHLVLGPGEHLSGGLRLYSHTTLELDPQAVLRFVPDYDAYAGTTVAIEAEQSDRAMLTASGATRLTLCGKGRILCDGARGFATGDDPVMGTRIPAARRPRVLVLDGCRGIALRDLRIEDSPMWTLHFVGCHGLTLEDVQVDNDRRMPNTDGIVIDGCTDVAIRQCQIRTADDGVVLKTSARLDGQAPAPCVNVSVSDCTIESRSCALKIGTESFADFRHILFERCQIEASNRGLGIFSRDGGVVSDVAFRNITVACQETPDGFWGSGEPLTVTVLDRRAHRPAGAVRNITVSGLRGSAPGAVNLWAERPGLIETVLLDEIDLVQSPGPLGTAGSYDLRPTPADLEPSPDAAGRVNAWRMGADGRVIGLEDYPNGRPAVFGRNVTGLTLTAVNVVRPDPLPEGWSVAPVTLVDCA